MPTSINSWSESERKIAEKNCYVIVSFLMFEGACVRVIYKSKMPNPAATSSDIFMPEPFRI